MEASADWPREVDGSNNPNGYTVTYNVPADASGHNTQPITGTITATAPSAFVPYFSPSNGVLLYFASVLPANAAWTATVTTQDGKTYANPQPGSTSSTSLSLSLSVPPNTYVEQLKSLKLQFTLPVGSVTTTNSPTTGSFVITGVSNNNGGFCGFNC